MITERDPLLATEQDGHPNNHLPAAVVKSPDSRASDGQKTEIRVYSRRWYILTIFSAMNFMQGYFCNIWSVIANSAESAFGWTNSDISLMLNWLFICYIVAIFPFSWLTNAKGLRVSVLLCSTLVLLGAVMRCIIFEPPGITWLAHVAHIFNGLAGPVAFAGGLILSGTWFPPQERATATAVATLMGYIGDAVCYILGPKVIFEVPPGEPVSAANRTTIINNIKRLRYSECAVIGVIFLMIVMYFPARPPSAPSISASRRKMKFTAAVRELFRKKNISFWLIAIAFGLAGGIQAVWGSLLDVNLKEIGVDQTEAGWFGFWGTLIGSLFAIFVGRVADFLVGKMKPLLLILMTLYIVSGYWILIMVNLYIPYSTTQMYVANILMGVAINGFVPLIFEMAVECSFPVPSEIASAVVTVMFQIPPPFFLLVFLIPNIGTGWMNWCQYIAFLVSFPLVLAVKEDYRRLRIDSSTHEIGVSKPTQNSTPTIQGPGDPLTAPSEQT